MCALKSCRKTEDISWPENPLIIKILRQSCSSLFLFPTCLIYTFIKQLLHMCDYQDERPTFSPSHRQQRGSSCKHCSCSAASVCTSTCTGQPPKSIHCNYTHYDSRFISALKKKIQQKEKKRRRNQPERFGLLLHLIMKPNVKFLTMVTLYSNVLRGWLPYCYKLRDDLTNISAVGRLWL